MMVDGKAMADVAARLRPHLPPGYSVEVSAGPVEPSLPIGPAGSTVVYTVRIRHRDQRRGGIAYSTGDISDTGATAAFAIHLAFEECESEDER